MKEKKPPVLKTTLLAYCAVGIFTVISIIGPILLGRDRQK
jgi:hypothetical protein